MNGMCVYCGSRNGEQRFICEACHKYFVDAPWRAERLRLLAAVKEIVAAHADSGACVMSRGLSDALDHARTLVLEIEGGAP